MSKKSPSTPAEEAAQANRAKQLNPNNDAYWRARGESRPAPNQGNKGKGA